MTRILVFDAYPSIRELLAEELAAEGTTVIPIAKPDLIPDLISTFEPDLLILDPYVRGKLKWELFDTVKAQDPTLPVVLFTQWFSADPRFSQADAFLSKSYDLEKLKEKIKEILAKRPSGESRSKNLYERKTKGAVSESIRFSTRGRN